MLLHPRGTPSQQFHLAARALLCGSLGSDRGCTSYCIVHFRKTRETLWSSVHSTAPFPTISLGSLSMDKINSRSTPKCERGMSRNSIDMPLSHFLRKSFMLEFSYQMAFGSYSTIGSRMMWIGQNHLVRSASLSRHRSHRLL